MSDEVQSFNLSQALGVECIQSIKTDLAKKGLRNSLLKSNLDYAMKAVEAMSISKRTNAVLQVEGKETVIKIITGQPIFHHTVWNDNDGPKLLQKIKVNSTQLKTKHIDESHFMGHCCRDEVMNCMEQAHKAVASIGEGLANVELKIRCGELQLTYTTMAPSTTIEIQPKWRGIIRNYYLEDVLRVKHHMEKVGEMSPGLLACFRLLLTVPPKPVQKNIKQILLMSEGQKVELVHQGASLLHTGNFVIFFDADKAKMYNETDHSCY
ncbi:uncharacterized protein LOC116223535 [Clupea harengus]|uniref:Uncharacterized protein LOC116223535 n=1 Tax=Clupea harengus TaxID=7950 RepID=A0A6P8GNS2_CLUHA|nr:uncharacterized protein LOC116223535 [Clupea harengus]